MNLLFTALGVICLCYSLYFGMRPGYSKRIFRTWLVVAGIFYALSRTWELLPAWLRLTLGIAMALGAGIFALIGTHLAAVIRISKRDRPMDYLIVLGARVFGKKPCDELKMRLDGALTRMQRHPQATVIVCGGKGGDEEFPEAEVMAEYVIARGLSPRRVLRESKSTSTYENLRFGKELIEDPDARIGIVSNSFHLYRAVTLAHRAGMKNAFPVYAATPRASFPHYFAREVASIVLGGIRGHL